MPKASQPKDKEAFSTAGQSGSNVIVDPSEGGWTSQAPSRRVPKRPRRKKSNSSAQPAPTAPTKYSRKKKDPSYIPRPENSFILFRRNFVRNRPPNSSLPRGQTLSKFVGEAWRRLPAAVKLEWARKANEVSKAHAQKYPGWKYSPVRQNIKAKAKTEEQRRIEENSVTFHSTESSPAPIPVSGSVTVDTSVPASIPNNTITTIHPGFIQRKQSLRLSNWDDSVVYPSNPFNPSFYEASSSFADYPVQPHVFTNYYPQTDALQRRSSSAPVSDFSAFTASNTIPGSSAENVQPESNAANVVSSYYQPTSHRLSYSGIRPGFVYQNMAPSVADGDNLSQEHTLLSESPLPFPSTPVTDSHSLVLRDSVEPESLNSLETSTQINIAITPTDFHATPQTMSWSRPVSHSPSLMAAAPPASFVSPIQQMSSIWHLDTDENNSSFGQPWSEFAHSSSPGHVFNTSMSTSTSTLTHRVETGAMDRTQLGDRTEPAPAPSLGEFVAANNNNISGDLLRCGGSVNAGVSSGNGSSFHANPLKAGISITKTGQVERELCLPSQTSILTEDVLDMEFSNDFDGWGAGEFTDLVHSDSLGMNVDSECFPIAPMNPVLDFYTTSSTGFRHPWGFSGGMSA